MVVAAFLSFVVVVESRTEAASGLPQCLLVSWAFSGEAWQKFSTAQGCREFLPILSQLLWCSFYSVPVNPAAGPSRKQNNSMAPRPRRCQLPLFRASTVLQEERQSHAETRRKLMDTEDNLEFANGEIEVLRKQIERDKKQFDQA